VPRVLALCYHAVSERWPAALSVTPAALRQQLTWLLSRGWRGATFTEAVLAPASSRTLAVTFDDGFDSVRTLAAPVLAELGLPATVFVATDWVGRAMRWPELARWDATEHADELSSMSWDGLRTLAAAGWEIGAHSCSHRHLTRLPDEALIEELERSRAVCEEQVGAICRSFAYPFGEADDRVRAAVEAVGYDVAAGLSPRAFRVRDRREWPRVGVWHAEPDWRFALKVTPLTSDLRRAPVVAKVQSARRRARSGVSDVG
jgi:peptidoglycan/xylan/chitin deacetylase (PgdA/CDA1 family)